MVTDIMVQVKKKNISVSSSNISNSISRKKFTKKNSRKKFTKKIHEKLKYFFDVVSVIFYPIFPTSHHLRKQTLGRIMLKSIAMKIRENKLQTKKKFLYNLLFTPCNLVYNFPIRHNIDL